MSDLPAAAPIIAKLQTHNLFIDTSIFRSKLFDLNNEALKKLGELGHEEKIYLYSTFITEGEIKNNLLEVVNESLTKSEKLNLHLRNAGLSEIDPEKFKEARITRWLEFTKRSNTTLIPIPDDSIEKVFDLYFNSEPPFHGERGKRHEFPDAFTIAALTSWCEENGDRHSRNKPVNLR
jgi:PIN domain-containing protein